jgi:Zn-dependent protease
MFFYYADLLRISFAVFLTFAGAVTAALVLGIAFHEFCHALSAFLLGDRTAKHRGRLTLNPLAHLDPLGTFLLFIAGFGWGKPTPVNPYNMRIEPRAGMAITAAAGPLSNLLVAAVMAIPIRAGWATWHDPFLTSFRTTGWDMQDYFGLFLGAAIWINCILAVFNFLPLAPLDGFRIWSGVLPIELARPLMRLEPYGMFILMAIFFLGPAIGINVFGSIVQPVGERITGTLTGVRY